MSTNKNNSLKDNYHLSYDNSATNSGLVKWYNSLIDKTIDELNAIDVAKMIRQGILKELAISKAVELFLKNPFDGEMCDGDLLSLLTSFNYDVLALDSLEELLRCIEAAEASYSDFDWDNDENKTLFKKNIDDLKVKLTK